MKITVDGETFDTEGDDNTRMQAPPAGWQQAERAVVIDTPPLGDLIIGDGLLTIHRDGTVTGRIEDAGPAARAFVDAIRAQIAHPALGTPTWDEREALSDAIQRLHLVDLNNLHEIVDAVITAGWRPADTPQP